jgi:hypothetical protein
MYVGNVRISRIMTELSKKKKELVNPHGSGKLARFPMMDLCITENIIRRSCQQ